MLDELDRKLLNELQRDASRATGELADAIGLSQSPTWRRMQRFRADGILKSVVALLDRRKLGLNTQVFAQVKLNAHGRQHLDEFAASMQSFPEVMECHVLMGPVDFLLRVVTTDVEAYERFFFEKLSRVPGVQEVNSTIALSQIKATTVFPL